ncbi:MAG: anaerobic ribonucleoside triphosphate reductase [Coriobacteriia bacterium]|nr:anaerobic ribonucleoside triphosphate reductase [Coriobacteriia bacterium]
MTTSILKRDGRAVKFDISKISDAIEKAFVASGNLSVPQTYAKLAEAVLVKLDSGALEGTPTVEGVQDLVEEVLDEHGYFHIARGYIKYREERARAREINTQLMQKIDKLTHADAKDFDIARENANIDANTAMGTMLKYGSETAKQYYKLQVLDPRYSSAHADGDIHIHDLDFYTLTTTCCQIDIIKLFDGGFSTGHGVLREPSGITSYSALACIAIQSNQNDQHGGQSISNFDYGMAEGVKKTYRSYYKKNLAAALDLLANVESAKEKVDALVARVEAQVDAKPSLIMNLGYLSEEKFALVGEMDIDTDTAEAVQRYAAKQAVIDTDKATHQAMEAFIHNLNTMHSRAGAQTPFSSINYGMDTSAEGRMVIKNVLLATEQGLGSGETPIFPIQIFRVKEGVNYNAADPNYDLFQQACRVSAKRLFPNFSFLDASFNAAVYQGTPETEVAYMGCRTRVIGNTFDPGQQVTPGRGNLSFTSINLPRLAIKAGDDKNLFFELLEAKLDLALEQMLSRFEIQKSKKVYNMPFLMGQGVWIGSEDLNWDDTVGEVLKHGTLSLGFIGLAETLVALMGEHHGQSERAQNFGLEIIGFMRRYLDERAAKERLNFTLLATPAEGLAGRFVALDRERYGTIAGVTDREYYTNSFHVPVYYDINGYKKIELEAPYHALTNAGHISYVELDGDPSENLEAFEAIIRHMKESGVGYGSINHPVDRDPVCGYSGIIGDRCPKCGRPDDGNPPFERIRRITGYLVGTLDRFNNAKRTEEGERVKHGVHHKETAKQDKE